MEDTESTSLTSTKKSTLSANWARSTSYSHIHSSENETDSPLKERPKGVKWRCCSLTSLQIPLTITCLILIAIGVFNVSRPTEILKRYQKDGDQPLIIIITPTYKRITRMADMLRCAQTLMLVDNVFWVVVEDGLRLSTQIQSLLVNSNIPHHYMFAKTEDGWPKKGWWQRNVALDWVVERFSIYEKHAVIYFMDDDNAYDHRLFDKYIRKVKNIGIWAVGLVGDSLVEAPHVENGVITKWNAFYYPTREYAVDMAGFAIGLPLILRTRARILRQCPAKVPETCLIRQLGIPKEEAEAFGWMNGQKEILVWHVKTIERVPRGINPFGYDVETLNAKEWQEHRNYSRRPVKVLPTKVNPIKSNVTKTIKPKPTNPSTTTIQKVIPVNDVRNYTALIDEVEEMEKSKNST